MSRLGMILEARISQECDVCSQEILPERQLPLNAIVIFDYAVCP
jgi:hypothetical protein